MQLIQTLISSILQLGIFTLIPFLFFLFRKDKSQKFTQYIGLRTPTSKSIFTGLAIAVVFVVVGILLEALDENVKKLYLSENTVTGVLHQMGMSIISVTILLIAALFKTSLSEEILFRGLIAKQLISKLGFQKGNILQAIIFGAVHFTLFFFQAKAPLILCVGVSVFSAVAAWLIGDNMMRNAKGSIIPGWISHGLGNVISYTIISFLL